MGTYRSMDPKRFEYGDTKLNCVMKYRTLTLNDQHEHKCMLHECMLSNFPYSVRDLYSHKVACVILEKPALFI